MSETLRTLDSKNSADRPFNIPEENIQRYVEDMTLALKQYKNFVHENYSVRELFVLTNDYLKTITSEEVEKREKSNLITGSDDRLLKRHRLEPDTEHRFYDLLVPYAIESLLRAGINAPTNI